MPKYRIMKLRADRIISFGLTQKKRISGYEVTYWVDLDKNAIYGAVVEEQLLMENCALFDQFQIVLKKEGEPDVGIRERLLQEFAIVDFTNIYKGTTDIPESFAKALITSGFIMKYRDKEIHMLPFDKSGNMSRKCRLSFIHAEHLDSMNERLNLGIDFGRVKVNLSKYYAYRGLYLSTARRIDPILLKITPETLVVINDNQDREYYKKDAVIEEGIPDEETHSKISFQIREEKKAKIPVPFDGQGMISPAFAGRINEMLGEKGINSFQIRLPFSKGMLHRVDFHGFIREFDSGYEEGAYIIKDAFGIERDLKLAHMILTKSMFKCFGWMKDFCGGGTDPMEFYCGAVEKYQHSLYVSSTDLPYGNSKATHLSYQFLNTLKLSEEQFQSLIDKQMDYIHNPIRYIEMTRGQCADDENGACYDFPNWQRAFLLDPSFGHSAYIKNQLKNIQAALMTKLALGKLVVKGQTRYMTRDLPFMAVNLIRDKQKRDKLRNLKIYEYRFFLPQGTRGENEMGLDYNTYCGFFRSPHLSRNEQGLLAPMVEKDYSRENYKKECDIFNRYFGHLTGVVIFGNESLEPMALGGADFDGDLVSMVMDSDVVDAIKAGVYKDKENPKGPLDIERREDVPYIKIPSLPIQNDVVPKTIPYLQVKNTFSNKIGLISNAAVAIGQSEYGEKESTDDGIKCSHCTILTGLEIDAAKNGVHPDLSILSGNKELAACGYLEFKKQFEKLKKRKDYHFNQLQVKKTGGKYTLGLKGMKNTIEYIEEKGTYINKLPIVFMENLNPELYIPDVGKKEHFCSAEAVTDGQKKAFEDQCKGIFHIYDYYAGLFTFIQREINGGDYSESNLKKLLQKQYDPEYAEKLFVEDVPYLFEIMAGKISNYTEYKNLEKEVNQKKWHLMRVEEKKRFLCELLDADHLDADKWAFVLQPYNHGYKALWYLVQILGRELRREYGDFKNRYQKPCPEAVQAYPYLTSQADALLKNYLENKETGVPAKLYKLCLETLRDVVRDCDLPVSKKIELLFRLTDAKGQKARFFWECFEWETLEPYIVKEDGHAE